MEMKFRYFTKLAGINLKHNFLPHLLAALAVVLLTPIVFEIFLLDEKLAAQPLEMLLSLVGVVLLVPIFFPEQDENIKDLIRSKKTDYLSVCILRIIYSAFTLFLIIGSFIIIMAAGESKVTIEHFIGTAASALFLGALGFLTAGISGNTTVGYMTSMIYYIINFAVKDKLGKFYLFSMTQGSFTEKYWLLGASVIMIITTFLYLKIREQ